MVSDPVSPGKADDPVAAILKLIYALRPKDAKRLFRALKRWSPERSEHVLAIDDRFGPTEKALLIILQ
jgi:hypothetical protein